MKHGYIYNRWQVFLPFYLFTLLLFSACRHDDYIVYMEEEDTGVANVKGDIIGMYLLNEGNMGSNKCTLDYLDLSDETVQIGRAHV